MLSHEQVRLSWTVVRAKNEVKRVHWIILDDEKDLKKKKKACASENCWLLKFISSCEPWMIQPGLCIINRLCYSLFQTGTLTEDGLDLWGIQRAEDGR